MWISLPSLIHSNLTALRLQIQTQLISGSLTLGWTQNRVSSTHDCCVDYFSTKLQLSVEVEVVFSRGTLSAEQQKKVPLSQTREQEHQVDGQ